jgi:MFS family permease
MTTELYSTRSKALRITVPLVAVLVGLASLLIALRVEQVLMDFAQARSLRAAHQVADQIENSFRLGLGLADQPQMGASLRRQQEQDPTLKAAMVQGDALDVVARSGDADAFAALNPSWTRRLLGLEPAAGAPGDSIVRTDGTMALAGVPAADTTGRRTAVVWLAYDRAALRESAWHMLAGLWPWAAGIGAVLAALLTALAAAWMRMAHARLDSAERALATDTEEARARGPADVVQAVEGGVGTHQRLWHEVLLLALAFAIAFAGLSALAWKARDIARPFVLAQVDQSSQTLLKLAQARIERALALGIPPEGLAGLDAMFRSELLPAAEIAFLAFDRGSGAPVVFTPRDGAAFSLGSQPWLSPGFRIAAQPVHAGGREVGRILAGTPLGYVDQRLQSILLDLLFAVIVSLVLVREGLGALWERSAMKPYIAFESAWQGWRRRARRLAGAAASATQRLDWLTEVRSAVRRFATDVRNREGSSTLGGVNRELVLLRLMVFLTAMSDELLRPFFAVFASEAQPLPFELSPTMLAGLPVAAFMLALALAQPLGPWLTQRVDMRRALFTVAVAGAALLAATAVARDSAVLMLLRAGSGAAYGLMLILAQTTIIRITDFGSRARGLVEVPAAIVAAGVCGPALGGLLVERFGTGASFGACAACLLLAALLALRLAPLPQNVKANLSGLGGWRGIAAVMLHRRVMAVTWLAAVPARLAAAALLVVVTPLYLLELGETSTVSGRVQLLYFLAFMVVAPWVARWSDIGRRRGPWVIGGCAVSALSCALLPWLGGVAGIAACCALLGVGQALLSAPQLALVTETFDSDPHATQVVGATPEQALASFRFLERVGSIVAPFAVAFAVGRFGLAGSVGAIGALLAAGAVGIALVLFNHRDLGQRHAEA